jgi:hypothetical protein
MRLYSPVLGLLLFWSFLSPPASLPTIQDQCTVKLSSLQGTYEGECKNGVAHGRGIAVGKDEYQGEFKNGLPHGKGRYIYANGDEYIGEFKKGKRHGKGYMKKAGEVTITENPRLSNWKNDAFAGEVLKGEYTFNRNRNIARHSFKLVERESKRVDIVIQGALRLDNLMVNISSGRYSVQSNSRIIIEDPEFPLNVIVEYETPDKLNSAILKVIADFVLETEGRWEVNLGN